MQWQRWHFVQRMFDHPDLTDEVIHPYDRENRGNAVSNLWGQRITSLVTIGSDLFVSTSAKTPCQWDERQNPFLAPEKWKSYGSVYRLSMPGHLGATTTWTEGPTKLVFAIHGSTISITQDGATIGQATVSGPLVDKLKAISQLGSIQWGQGIYGPFGGKTIKGSITDKRFVSRGDEN